MGSSVPLTYVLVQRLHPYLRALKFWHSARLLQCYHQLDRVRPFRWSNTGNHQQPVPVCRQNISVLVWLSLLLPREAL
jgi:hypothetical protein